jgi:hypothetical protein
VATFWELQSGIYFNEPSVSSQAVDFGQCGRLAIEVIVASWPSPGFPRRATMWTTARSDLCEGPNIVLLIQADNSRRLHDTATRSRCISISVIIDPQEKANATRVVCRRLRPSADTQVKKIFS